MPSGAGESPVSLEIDEGVAVVTLDRPPVNALRPEVWEALFPLLRKAHANPAVKAIVLTGANGKFCAGFDYTLFGTPAMAAILDSRGELLGQLAALLENGSKPTVAAIEGAALGGGLEMAMACNARVAADGAQLGLPEVRLGLLPGMGGTQRLPRLVGVPQALNLMLSGQSISAEDGLAIGLVDKVTAPPSQLLTAAKAAALELAASAAPRRRALQLSQHMQQVGEVFAAAAAAVAEAQARVNRSLAGQQHYLLLLEAVAAGLAQGAPTGLQQEGEGFRAACESRLHRLLLGMFKLSRQLKTARGPAWVLLQVQQFLGFAWIWFYVHWIYVWTSFLMGYNKARKRSKDRAAAGSGSAAGGSRAAAGARKKK
ncbi:hypothetical protein ABPG75_011281 [Micractinium tetrahymenae]